MTFYRIAAGVMQSKRHTTSRGESQRDVSKSTHINEYGYITLLYRFAIRAIVYQRVRHLSDVMGAIERDRADRELRRYGESYQLRWCGVDLKREREIVSRRDRNYPSQSLVGNISAGWHAKTLTDVYRPTDGRRRAQEIPISGYRMHLSPYAPRGAAAGESWPARQSALFNVEILICWRGL